MADDENWRFLGSEGCALCDAMDGFYEEEPTPPHPKCQCQIIAPGTEYEKEEEETPRPWRTEDVSSVRGEGGNTERGVVIIMCPDGTEHVGLYDHFIADDDPRELEEIAAEMENEMEDLAEELFEEECPEEDDDEYQGGDVIT
jgi:hypothetical protein